MSVSQSLQPHYSEFLGDQQQSSPKDSVGSGKAALRGKSIATFALIRSQRGLRENKKRQI